MKNCVEQLRGLVTRHLTSDHQWPSDRNWRAEFGAFSGFSPHHLSTVWLDRTVTICTNTQKPSFPRNRSRSTSAHPLNLTYVCAISKGGRGGCATAQSASIHLQSALVRIVSISGLWDYKANVTITTIAVSVLRSCGGREVLCSLYMWIFILNNHCCKLIGNFRINKKYWFNRQSLYGSVSAGREKWLFNVLFFLK